MTHSDPFNFETSRPARTSGLLGMQGAAGTERPTALPARATKQTQFEKHNLFRKASATAAENRRRSFTSPQGAHKKLPGEVFDIASAMARRVAAMDGWPQKTSGRSF
jgi:hypothetical protein